MIYEILHLKLGEAQLKDEKMQTDHEILPSGRFVLIRDIRKALAGEDFFYFPAAGGKGIMVNGTTREIREAYYESYINFKHFGLPHGRGWLNELPWIIDFYRTMDKVYADIESWMIDKQTRNDGASPGEVGF